MTKVIDDEIAREVVRCVLNIARVETLGWWIDDHGQRVHGDREYQIELLRYRLKTLGQELLASTVETEIDPSYKGAGSVDEGCDGE